MGEIEAHVPELDVVAPDLLQPGLHVPDIGDLAAQMEVDQLEDVLPVHPVEPVEQLHQLDGAEPELRPLPAALGPAARALGGQLDPHAGGRLDAHLVRHLEQHLQLAELLQHDHHLVPQLLAHQRQAHELLVLVAVADDQVIAGLAQAEHRLSSGLLPTSSPTP